MKKLIHHINSYSLLVLLAAIVLIQQGCKKDESSSSSSSAGVPVITAIRNYVAHPGDSLLSQGHTGQWVVISGKNLKGATQISFDGINAYTNDALFTDTSAVTSIPDTIVFPLIAAKVLNTITYVTTHGQTTFSFKIVPAPPVITGMSNEYANSGDSVKIYGAGFYNLTDLTYAGLPVTGYTSSIDGTTISLVVPAGMPQNGGVVVVKTKGGTTTTTYNVHDFVTGVFCNWDNINTYPWGSNTSSSSTAYPGNTGQYDVISATNMPAGANDWYDSPYSINMGAGQWVPASAINDNPANYAVKFEIAVSPGTPWTNGILYISNGGSFVAAYAPWQSKGSFITNGWQTVTLPLSTFINGSTPPSSITDVTGPDGNGSMTFRFMNYASSQPVVSFAAAIDNIRVERIAIPAK
jgi:hypothetical protein